jgi:hypothetical protein
MIENLFVIFPPAAGGNHLANIVSISPKFATRFAPEVYEDSNRHKTHPGGGGKNFYHDETSLKLLQSTSNVFCSHFAEYMSARALVEKYLQNRKFLIVEFPEHARNKFFLDRATKYYPAYQDQYFVEETAMLYSTDMFCSITKETNLEQITVDTVFTNDVTSLVTQINSKFDLNLELDTVKYLHQKWLEKNGQS